ncbi:DoxX family protein [Pseudonocardia sp. TRM90224]|uniref:DoxX family protein n=1 Tax=Pseudonocardia sp. TRM90224 TaxID=2812678 RepID=UPI001E405CE8|nr:DoxX family protein [Pseudonocardia sp. TRM90224]
MRIAVWIVSALLALAFLFIGGTKVLMPVADMEAASMGVPVVLLKIAGVAEVLGAFGIILPAATRILPALTPVAAAGLTLTMVGATVINIGLGIYALAAQTAVLGLLAALVAWARFGPAAIAPRGQAPVRSRDAAPST